LSRGGPLSPPRPGGAEERAQLLRVAQNIQDALRQAELLGATEIMGVARED
jgi:hypothetical protein